MKKSTIITTIYPHSLFLNVDEIDALSPTGSVEAGAKLLLLDVSGGGWAISLTEQGNIGFVWVTREFCYYENV